MFRIPSQSSRCAQVWSNAQAQVFSMSCSLACGISYTLRTTTPKATTACGTFSESWELCVLRACRGADCYTPTPTYSVLVCRAYAAYCAPAHKHQAAAGDIHAAYLRIPASRKSTIRSLRLSLRWQSRACIRLVKLKTGSHVNIMCKVVGVAVCTPVSEGGMRCTHVKVWTKASGQDEGHAGRALLHELRKSKPAMFFLITALHA